MYIKDINPQIREDYRKTWKWLLMSAVFPQLLLLVFISSFLTNVLTRRELNKVKTGCKGSVSSDHVTTCITLRRYI